LARGASIAESKQLAGVSGLFENTCKEWHVTIISHKFFETHKFIMTTVRTRLAPSPTGDDIHIGNLHTALINYTVALKHKGQFIVRLEDTDQAREVKGSGERILQSLIDYGLEYAEGPDRDGKYGPYKQSERLEIYQRYVKELIESGAAYYCVCSKERLTDLRQKQQKQKQVPCYDKHCVDRQDAVKKQIETGQQHVVRLNVTPGQEISFEDTLRGTITFNSSDVDDQVLLKSDGFPTYHLAVVIDDHFMQITHVIRGEDWIPSTPKHVLLYRAFGWELPIFAHTPLLRNPDKSKLSKRKNPVWAGWYLSEGYLPQALINYLSLMGWTHPKQQEIFDMEEFAKVFDLSHMQPGSPIFDIVKLSWMNGEYIRSFELGGLSHELGGYLQEYKGEQWDKIKKHKKVFEASLPLVQERMKILSEYWGLCAFFYEAPTKYEINIEDKKALLKKISSALESARSWEVDAIGEILQGVAIAQGVKNRDLFQVVRVAITGRKISPPLNESMQILGKKECLARLSK